MLTSYPTLDSSFSNPVVFVSCPLSPSSSVHHHQICFQLPRQPEGEELWLRGCASAPVIAAHHLSAGHFFWWPEDHLKDICRADDEGAPETAMDVVQPEEDLKRLVDNELQLRLSGYYHGSLGSAEAVDMLKRCDIGTFLVRDSEHASYLYTLSVQTASGPTSCRIEYDNGRFLLDSSAALSVQMPRFDSVTDLIDHYVQLTKNLPQSTTPRNLSPVWLDLAGSCKQEVPVQIYKPLYRGVRSLQHICRVKMARILKKTRPHAPLSRTIDEQEYEVLPTVLKDYLKEYPYSQ